MSTEELRDATADRVLAREEAAHEQRNWVRLTFDCNDRCIFCLDSDAHHGQMRSREEVKHQILDGRRKGAERLVLSGGEPTIHPDFVDFVRLGRLAGYPWIQTVTNGRLFAYPEFLKRSLDAGLNEITFSVHGPNAKVHDALVGVPGAFAEETRGLHRALEDGRPVVNIDVCVNRANVRHLPEMLEMFIAWGVKEFDLLQVIPFGKAFRDGRHILFYDLEETQPYLQKAFAYSRRPDIHLWLNRFPPPHLENYEHLIQDPHKLLDEVRGRQEEYARVIEKGVDLPCREPDRCRHCYMQSLCDALYGVANQVNGRRFEVVRVDTQWEAQQGPVWGGDPASARNNGENVPLPVLSTSPELIPPLHLPLRELVAESTADTLEVCAPTLVRAQEVFERFPGMQRLQLELDEYEHLGERLDEGGRLSGMRLVRVIARTSEQAQTLLEIPGDFEVLIELTNATAPWLLGLRKVSPRLALRQPSYERVSTGARHDVNVQDFFERFRADVPVEGVPACVTGRLPRIRQPTLDTAMMGPEGRLEIFRFAQRYILEHFWTKSLRCKRCVHDSSCVGMHINHVRTHGYAVMQPVTEPVTAGSAAVDERRPCAAEGPSS